MGETFEPNDAAKDAWPTMSKAIDEAAFNMADDFIQMGMGTAESSSLVANLLVRSAWVVAGTGRIATGETPNPEAFIGVARDITDKISWPEKTKDEGVNNNG
jgi:hypothetical protein